MPFTIIQRGIFRPEIIHLRITRRKPPAHLLDAGTTLGGGFVSRGVCCFGRCGGRGKIRATFIVFFVK